MSSYGKEISYYPYEINELQSLIGDDTILYTFGFILSSYLISHDRVIKILLRQLMIKTFKIIAILEGISYLLLLLVTMPLKYLADMPAPNQYVGMAHGFLFITYVILAFIVWRQKNWTFKRLLVVLVASLLPFATFYVERNYL